MTARRAPREGWTNSSVKLLAEQGDPVAVILVRARQIVMKALDAGWQGPPFDPVELATRHLGLQVAATADVREARTVPTGQSARIEYNPNRPRERRRYSIAHEIAHTLFPDYAERVRHRGSHHAQHRGDDWQLESLCNLAAAEFLMPVGTLSQQMERDDLRIENLIDLRSKFDVSMEALLIRAARMATGACAVFAASRVENGDDEGRYRLEYLIPSQAWTPTVTSRTLLPADTKASECTAIAFTSKGSETWSGERVHLEAVGIPPYPWSATPRVAGIVWPTHSPHVDGTESLLTMVTGDALSPRGKKPKVIAHVVNDSAYIWGGRGFAAAVRRKWPAAQRDFQVWAMQGNLRMKRVHFFDVDRDLTIASMVAQRGYGEATGERRLKYAALEACLEQVAAAAAERNVAVHMPRIGSGQGGAPWGIVQELVRQALSTKNVPVVVYSLPSSPVHPQGGFDFTVPLRP
jgi:O-acetyl-ADP-ribose deacetylase (regulator of RNase III)